MYKSINKWHVTTSMIFISNCTLYVASTHLHNWLRLYALIILLLYIASGNVAHISILIYPLWCSWSPWCIGTISPAWCLYFPYFLPIVIFQQYNIECLNPAYLVLMNTHLHLVNLTFLDMTLLHLEFCQIMG